MRYRIYNVFAPTGADTIVDLRRGIVQDLCVALNLSVSRGWVFERYTLGCRLHLHWVRWGRVAAAFVAAAVVVVVLFAISGSALPE